MALENSVDVRRVFEGLKEVLARFPEFADASIEKPRLRNGQGHALFCFGKGDARRAVPLTVASYSIANVVPSSSASSQHRSLETRGFDTHVGARIKSASFGFSTCS
jgi:hypothetical protein